MENSIVYYINLDERPDRKQHIENELIKIFPKDIINRISAIKHKTGAIGCSNSHIDALFNFIKSKKDVCYIFEDDFQFLFPPDEIKEILNNVLKEDFNVIMMSYNGLGIDINCQSIKNNF